MSNVNEYQRANGVIGYGFEILHCSRPMHSISWPDELGERMTQDELDRKGVKVQTVALESAESVEDDGEDWKSAYLALKKMHAELKAKCEADETPSKDEVSPVSEAESIRNYLTENPKASNKEVVEALGLLGIEINSSQVSTQRKRLAG